jgi:hypothetical protein
MQAESGKSPSVRIRRPRRGATLAFVVLFWALLLATAAGLPLVAMLALWSVYTGLLIPPVALAFSYVEASDGWITYRNYFTTKSIDRQAIANSTFVRSLVIHVGAAELEDGSYIRLRAIDAGNGLSRAMEDSAGAQVDALQNWLSG